MAALSRRRIRVSHRSVVLAVVWRDPAVPAVADAINL